MNCFYFPLLGLLCTEPALPDNVLVKRSEPSTYMPGDILQYQCIEGYEHVGGDLQRHCGRQATFEGHPPLCTGKFLNYVKWKELQTDFIGISPTQHAFKNILFISAQHNNPNALISLILQFIVNISMVKSN